MNQRTPRLCIAAATAIGIDARVYEIAWEFDANANDFELVAIESIDDASGQATYKTKVRHPVRNGSPLLVMELQASDGQTGFRLGGSNSMTGDEILRSLLRDCWTWNPSDNVAIQFRDLADANREAWRFIADAVTRTNPPTAQPVICIHSPKREVLADEGSYMNQFYRQILPSPAYAGDSLVRASKEVALLFELPLLCEMVSIWNSGFSKPRILTFKPSEVLKRLESDCEVVNVALTRVASEADLPTL